MKKNLFVLLALLTLAVTACSTPAASETPVPTPTPEPFYLTTLQSPLLGQTNSISLFDPTTKEVVKLTIRGESNILSVEEIRSDNGAGMQDKFELGKQPINLSSHGWRHWDGIVVSLNDDGNVTIDNLTSWQVK